MALNPSIILAGQSPDIVGAMSRGQTAGAQMADIRQQAQYRNALQQYGPGAVQGDQNALAALARFDPNAVQGMQINSQNMDIARAAEGRAAQMFPVQMETAQFNLNNARAQGRREAEAWTMQLDASQREAAAQQLQQAVTAMGSAQTPEQWDAYARELGLDDYVGRFDDRGFLIAQAGGQLEVLAPDYQMVDGIGVVDMNNPPESVMAGQYQAPSEGFRMATPEEASQYGAQAGQFGPDGRFYPINPPTGMEMTMGPDGTVRFIQGAGAGTRPPEADPSAPESMISTIDGILNDPDLGQAVGVRGAVNSRLGPLAPNAARVTSRLEQLEGQAFLQAFESLKGGGQITEIEGQKATQAMGRLSRAQSEGDYREALTELRGILELARTRPAGWANTPEGMAEAQRQLQPATQATPDLTDDQILQMYLEAQ